MRYGAVGCQVLTRTVHRTAETSPDELPCGSMWCGEVGSWPATSCGGRGAL